MKVYEGVLLLDYFNPGKKEWGWNITHVPTGKSVCNPRYQQEGKRLVLALLDAGKQQGWDWHNLTKANVEAMIPIISPPAPPPIPKGMGITPVEVLGYTPSPEVELLTRTAQLAWLGEGDFYATADALNDRRDWEVAVARMTTGKNAILAPSDVPQRAHSPTGVPCDLPNCKRLFRELMEIGTKIDDVAAAMQGLIAVGEPDGRDEDQWVLLEKELQGLIWEGWMNWGVCVTVFTTLGLPEQAPFIKRLGFLGSQEKGWHALGKKTFLRSKLLAGLLPLRREIRRRNNNYGE